MTIHICIGLDFYFIKASRSKAFNLKLLKVLTHSCWYENYYTKRRQGLFTGLIVPVFIDSVPVR